ncbi:MAG: Protein translocase subunit SecE [Chlamydiae bacterium]|nr:Protein translocase subunit SecE [Chlamydiota bacterium]
MDEKSGQAKATPKKVDKRKFLYFFGEVKQELKKVDWTSKEELKNTTKIVLAGIFVFGMFVYFIDLVIRAVLSGIDIVLKFFIG